MRPIVGICKNGTRSDPGAGPPRPAGSRRWSLSDGPKYPLHCGGLCELALLFPMSQARAVTESGLERAMWAPQQSDRPRRPVQSAAGDRARPLRRQHRDRDLRQREAASAMLSILNTGAAFRRSG